jgi:putative transcriptional regulator
VTKIVKACPEGVGVRHDGPMVDACLTGALLVASPALDDPNFARTVILLLDHDADGAVGMVLNRPTDISASDALPEWAFAATEPAVVHVGGPVTPQAVVCLGRIKAGVQSAPAGWRPLAGAIGALDLDEASELVDALDAVRFFAGYAGWGPGQLERELRIGGWLVLAADPNDPFTAEPAKLWSSVLRRQGGDLALLSTMPADPSDN